jgi:hypothetical protein
MCEDKHKGDSESEKGRCSQGVSAIRERKEKGLTQELYHEERIYYIS